MAIIFVCRAFSPVLCKENDCHCLVERGAVKVERRPHGEDEAGDIRVDAAVVLQTSHADREGGSGGARAKDSAQDFGQMSAKKIFAFASQITLIVPP